MPGWAPLSSCGCLAPMSVGWGATGSSLTRPVGCSGGVLGWVEEEKEMFWWGETGFQEGNRPAEALGCVLRGKNTPGTSCCPPWKSSRSNPIENPKHAWVGSWTWGVKCGAGVHLGGFWPFKPQFSRHSSPHPTNTTPTAQAEPWRGQAQFAVGGTAGSPPMVFPCFPTIFLVGNLSCGLTGSNPQYVPIFLHLFCN